MLGINLTMGSLLKGIGKLGFRVMVGNVSRNKYYYELLYGNQKIYNYLK